MKFYGKIFCAFLAALTLSTSAPAFAADTQAESAPGEIKLYADFGKMCIRDSLYGEEKDVLHI